jgi:hypothetical protein
VYGGKDGLIVKTDKQFENNCILLQQEGISNPKQISIIEFYQAIELIKKQREKDGKPKKHKRT